MTRRRTQGRTRRGGRRTETGVRLGRWLFVAVPAAAVLILIATLSIVLQGEQGENSPDSPGNASFPSYVLNASWTVREAYAQAVEYPEVLRYVPCYCGCGQHSGHTSIHDCFVEPGRLSGGPVVFDPHGANCPMCVDIARSSVAIVNDGGTIQDARDYAETRYGRIGSPTDTPPPPL